MKYLKSILAVCMLMSNIYLLDSCSDNIADRFICTVVAFPGENDDLKGFKDTIEVYFSKDKSINDKIEEFHYIRGGSSGDREKLSIEEKKCDFFNLRCYNISTNLYDYDYFFDTNERLIYVYRIDWNLEEYEWIGFDSIEYLKDSVKQKYKIKRLPDLGKFPG